MNQSKGNAFKSSIIYSVLILGILPFFIACKKEVPATLLESKTFLRVYPEEGNQYLWYLKPTQDNGFIMAGNENDSLFIAKANEKGEFLWKKIVPGTLFKDMLVTDLKDGSILISTQTFNGRFCKLDPDGNIEFVTKFWESLNNTNQFGNSYPVQLDNGEFMIASCNGGSGVGVSNNFITQFDKNGKMIGNITINDNSFLSPGETKFKTLYLDFIRCEKKGEYYFNGYAFLNWSGNWSENSRMFLAKQTYDNSGNLISNKKVWLDSAKVNYSNANFYKVATSDSGVVLASTRADHNYINNGIVIKADKDLNIEWQKDLNLSYFGTYCNNANECPDGNYIITGTTKLSEKSLDQPFAVKMDKSGNIIWTKIFNTSLNAYFNTGRQTADGSYLFGGSTTGFGGGKNKNDMFVIKTDKDRNFK